MAVVKLTALPDADAGSVVLTVRVTDGTQVQVTRVDPDGTAAAVREADPAQLADGYWLGRDHEAPPASTVTYELTCAQGSDTVTVTTPDIPGRACWLKHPLRPWLSMLLPYVGGQDDRSRPSRNVILQPLGRETAVSLWQPRGPETSGLRLWTFDAARTQQLEDLTADGCPLLLQMPAGYGPSRYVDVGDWQQARTVPTAGWHPTRAWTLPFTVVDAPSGVPGGTAGNTYADLLEAYTDYGALRGSGRTWGDVLLSAAPPAQAPDF